jgi:pimeloyl-ACP methyl ester carboxylesterase
LRLLLFIFLIFTSYNTFATSWLGGLKETYNEVKQKITKKSEPLEESVLAFPNPATDGWVYSYFQEPVFNSKVAILQTGLQHKESILLVHGLGQLGMQDWYSVIPFLATKYHVIAVDLPGFGYSEKPEGRYSPTRYAKVIEAVSEKFSKGRFTLIGHSMGGAVSLRFASMYPESLKKLILVDVAGVLHQTAFVKNAVQLNLDENKSHDKLKNIVSQVNDLGGSLVELISANSVSETIQESEFAWNLIKGSPNTNAAVSLIEENFSLALPKVSVETFIIWGAEDNVAPLRTAKVLEQHIQGARLSVIDGAGHVPMKSHNELFLKLLETSLNGTITKQQPIESLVNKGDLICENLNNQKYSGSYNKVHIKNCSNVQLIDLTAKQWLIEDSLVNAENITIKSEYSAFTAVESVVNITNGLIHSKKAIKLSGSRLDVAGVNIIADENSIIGDVGSKLIFSVSHIKDKFYQGHVHGTYSLKNQTIAQKLME